jgi:hypothetical protein
MRLPISSWQAKQRSAVVDLRGSWHLKHSVEPSMDACARDNLPGENCA